MSNFNPDLKFVLAFQSGDDSKQSFMFLLLKRKEVMVTLWMEGLLLSQQVIDNGEVKVSMVMNRWSKYLESNYRFKQRPKCCIVLDGYKIMAYCK